MIEKNKLNFVKLSDKFEINKGRIFINGSQAIARLAFIQKSLDSAAGLNTSGFISGYRGSPMGLIDATLWQMQERLNDADIVFQPGVNEDLAATAIWGTQQYNFFQKPLVDGVFSFWYGKGPGIDRSGDALRHANLAGTHKNGGVLVFYGDDHPGKSSTVVCQSEPALAAIHIPSLYPSNVEEIIEFGVLGWALSRYCGLWIGIKCINETVEQTQTVDIDIENFNINLPDRGASANIVNLTPGFTPPVGQDMILKRHRLPLVHKFVRANNIDKVKLNGKGGLGIVTSGKTYEDVLQAMNLIGLNNEKAEKLGIGIYKVGCIWPLEPLGLKEFAKDRPELLFIEEKDAFIEDQAAKLLINEKKHPQLIGKFDADGNAIFVSDELLDPLQIGQAIAARLRENGRQDNEIDSYCDQLTAIANTKASFPSNGPDLPMRLPYFCSGCPHNTSTKVPQGSLAMAGIGCHAIALFYRQDTLPPTQMGGEGMNWVGASHFSGTNHMFQNLGDGTYYHSGLLAIRAAVAAGINITYKILYNDAVAMTGGQPIDGPISVAQMIRQVKGEGIVKCVLVTDSPLNYKKINDFPKNIEIYHRDQLDFVQKQMREIEGTSVLIYEQTCAAEKRRRRKRGTFPNPAKRIFINDSVCEGCGDCSVQSTCVSIQPLDTPFGVKRKIDQSGCNKDYSCLKGFCPSFVTILGAEPAKRTGIIQIDTMMDLVPEPKVAVIENQNMSIMIAGIGGTGVITVGAILGMAAYMENKACSIYDMTGLSQKNGAVFSHLRIAQDNEGIATQRIGVGEADLVMGFDLLAALSGDAAVTYSNQRTKLVGNSDVTLTSAFQFDRNASIDKDQVTGVIRAKSLPGHSHFIDATNIALKLCGDTLASNMFMVGFALQKGLLPVSCEAIIEAIKLNGVAVSFNLTALSYGRLYSHAPDKIEALLGQDEPAIETLDTLIKSRIEHLSDYQNVAYAAKFIKRVEQIKAAEMAVDPSSIELTKAVVLNLSKLMSYKDEYEVARLYSDPAFLKKIQDQFETGFKLKFNLAPPLFSKKDRSTGQPLKSEYGSWVMILFKILSKMKGLRGGAFDVFARTNERKMERKLIEDYNDMLDLIVAKLNLDNFQTALKLANLPDQIRGFGHVKTQSITALEAKKTRLLKSLKG